MIFPPNIVFIASSSVRRLNAWYIVSTFGNINTHESFRFRNFCLFNGNKIKKIIISFCFNARKLDLSTLIRYFSYKRSLCTVFIRKKNLSSFSKRKLGFLLLSVCLSAWWCRLVLTPVTQSNSISSEPLHEMNIICSKNCALMIHTVAVCPDEQRNCLSFQTGYNFRTNDKDWHNEIKSIECTN